MKMITRYLVFFGAMPIGAMIVVMFEQGMLAFMLLGFVLLAFIRFLLYFFPGSNETDLYVQYRYPPPETDSLIEWLDSVDLSTEKKI